MDENINTGAAEAAETTGAGDGWDADIDSIIAEYGNTGEDEGGGGESAEASETKDAEDEAGADGETEAADGGGAERGDGQEEKPAAEPEPETFTLKHLDEVRTVGREEVVTLAQKGMDYDRIRGKLDSAAAELNEIKDWFKTYAGGQDFQSFRDNVEAAKLAKEQGIDPKTALERVKLNRERQELESERRQVTHEKQEADSSAAEADARAKDVREFTRRYPEVASKMLTDKDAIPKEVWDSVRGGETLVNAYGKYAAKREAEAKDRRIAELEAQLKDAQKATNNRKNAERSTGSQKTDGEEAAIDLIAAGWNSV